MLLKVRFMSVTTANELFTFLFIGLAGVLISLRS